MNLLRAGLLALVFLASQSSAATAVDTIAQRLHDSLVSPAVNSSVPKWLASQLPDGTWSDIDYADHSQTGWSPVDHPTRLLAITQAWAKPGSAHYGVDSVLKRVVKGLEVYLARNPYSTNWWSNEIGEDLPWGQTLVLLRGTVADSTLARWALRIDGQWAKWTGANLSWMGSAHIYRSIVRNEPEGVDSVLKRMRQQVVLVDSGDGLHRDFSFSQHSIRRTFPYNGGYGESFLDETIRWWVLAQGTRFAFSAAETILLDSMVVEGTAWMLHAGKWDPTMLGRGLVRPGTLSGSGSLRKAALNLRPGGAQGSLDSVRAWLAGTGPWFRSPNKVFWTCGYMAHHGKGWMTSIRAPRRDETATEAGNGENLKGWFLAMGSTWIRVRGDERDLIWPVFDWASIPGVTNDRVDTFPGQNLKNAYVYGTTDFVGGVSDGSSAAFGYDYLVSSVRGKKAWFQTPDALVALGSGLAFDVPRPVSTSIDQRWSRGAVTLGVGSSRSTLTTDSVASRAMGWIHHDSVGYWFPRPESLTIGATIRTGTWKSVDTQFTDTLSRGKVFFARVEHGRKSDSTGYVYAIVPGISADSMQRWVARKPIEVVVNTKKVQAIRQGTWRGMVFHAGDTVTFGDGLRVAVDRPCVLLRSEVEGGIVWTAAAPDRTTGTLGLSWTENGTWKRAGLALPAAPRLGDRTSLFQASTTVATRRASLAGPRLSWKGRQLVVGEVGDLFQADLVNLDGSFGSHWDPLRSGQVLEGARPGQILLLRRADGASSVLRIPPPTGE
jgi:chondroitin AC lyase